MRAAIVTRFGAPDVLEVSEVADPIPGPGDSRPRPKWLPKDLGIRGRMQQGSRALGAAREAASLSRIGSRDSGGLRRHPVDPVFTQRVVHRANNVMPAASGDHPHSHGGRPPLHHQVLPATGRNQRQRSWLVGAVFRPLHLPPFDTGSRRTLQRLPSGENSGTQPDHSDQLGVLDEPRFAFVKRRPAAIVGGVGRVGRNGR
jgi:hypothetical protein